jgi:RecJ-like exonuclease
MQDAFPLKRMRFANINTIVIDHHFPNPVIDDIVDVHINPFLVGGDENFVAGALSLELANLLYSNVNKEMAHLACIADVSNMRDYKTYARFDDDDFYDKLSLVMDFEINQMRGMALSVINKLINADKDLVYMMYDELKEKIKTVEDISLKNCKITKKHKFDYYLYDIKSISLREYPFNKAPGFLSWKLNKQNESFVLVAFADDYIQFRSSYDGFSVLEIIELLKKNMPDTIVDGGGHAMAGTIKISSLKVKEAIGLIELYLDGIDISN